MPESKFLIRSGRSEPPQAIIRPQSVLKEESMSGFSKSYLDFVVEVADSRDTQQLDDVAQSVDRNVITLTSDLIG